MGLPKGFIKNVKITKTRIGVERREEMLDEINNQGTFLPRGVGYEDMDKTFIESINNDFSISIDGDKVPVIFLTIQRWAEFSRTWEHSDNFKDIKLPFITIVRRPDVQVGTNQAGNWNIPQGRKTYTYVKVPTWEGGRKGIDLYKIPQPTSVDVTYEVRLFCNKMRDLNKLHKVVQENFNSRQHYISPNGHPMPIHLESIGDESPIEDFENRRFYVQLFEMKLLGYLLDEDKFEIVPTINKSLIVTELDNKTPKVKLKITNEDTGAVNYNFVFKPKTIDNFTFNVDYDITFTDILNISNILEIIIKVNNVIVTTPFTVKRGDNIFIEINKDSNNTSGFLLKGKLI